MRRATRDNRRLIVRVLSVEIMALLADWARAADEDLIAVLVFTGILAANIGHLPPKPALRYTEADDIPPDTVRRPVQIEALAEGLRLPRAIVTVYVRELIERGLVAEVQQGVIVPAAGVALLETSDTLNIAYDHALTLFERLQAAGLGSAEASKPNRI